jgi:hypothetical protein
MMLATEYAMAARMLAKRFGDPRERAAAQAKMRALPRIEDGDAGFLKARTASFLKSMVLNAEQNPPAHAAEFCQLLLDTANYLLILPDTTTGRSPRAPRPAAERLRSSGGTIGRTGPQPPLVAFVRPVPERD